MPPNQPATPTSSVRFPVDLREQLRRIADERGETFTAVVIRACWQYVRHYPDHAD